MHHVRYAWWERITSQAGAALPAGVQAVLKPLLLKRTRCGRDLAENGSTSCVTAQSMTHGVGLICVIIGAWPCEAGACIASATHLLAAPLWHGMIMLSPYYTPNCMLDLVPNFQCASSFLSSRISGMARSHHTAAAIMRVCGYWTPDRLLSSCVWSRVHVATKSADSMQTT